MEKNLKLLMKEYIEDFLKKQKDPNLSKVIVENSIPIVWFGDIDKYSKSKKKIVTVALNPSFNEFYKKDKETSKKDVVKRFEIVDFKEGITDENIFCLKETLCNYFKGNPYNKWFNWPEYALNVLGATYYSSPKYKEISKDIINEFDTAIHIDVVTAIATDPTLSKIDLIAEGNTDKLKNVDLFKKLIKFLDPDIIMISVNDEDEEEILSLFPDCCFKLTGERSQIRGKYEKKVSIRRYESDNKKLFWISPWKSSAFAQSHDFIKENIKELM